MKREELLLHIFSNVNCFKIAVILSKLKIIFLLLNSKKIHSQSFIFILLDIIVYKKVHFNVNFYWYKLVQIQFYSFLPLFLSFILKWFYQLNIKLATPWFYSKCHIGK